MSLVKTSKDLNLTFNEKKVLFAPASAAELKKIQSSPMNFV